MLRSYSLLMRRRIPSTVDVCLPSPWRIGAAQKIQRGPSCKVTHLWAGCRPGGTKRLSARNPRRPAVHPDVAPYVFHGICDKNGQFLGSLPHIYEVFLTPLQIFVPHLEILLFINHYFLVCIFKCCKSSCVNYGLDM